MKCPACGANVSLNSPGYSGGQPPSFVCYGCDVYGRRFSADTPEAWAESDASRAASKANARARRAP